MNNKRKIRVGNVIALNEDKPLLKSLGYQALIGMITPEEIKEAETLLEEYLENFPNVDNKKVVLAYLFGVLQGMDEAYKDLSGSGLGLANRLKKIHNMGQQLGMTLAMLLFQKEEKKKDDFPVNFSSK